ncbi:MAG TPA: heavy-metal-associated domain-containing protein [Planctomycetes bacterium]|jgi:copper chaperone CopZ|nr:heavy-metal-associated domain-containing protein [Planctomycetota bacterium]HIL51481.1 heavy-metal-associated domain-containing protein [Planctomycetota bacterium]
MCPPRVQSALSSVDGVEGVEVSFANKTATIATNGKADTEAMMTALEEAGFGGTLLAN